eukprot:XP_011683042.1 PREDICTED: uncharacterized protein LOC105447093 [Strongylocentrotus purpuratus]
MGVKRNFTCSLRRVVVMTIWIGLGCLAISVFRAPSEYDMSRDPSRSQLLPLLRADVGRQMNMHPDTTPNKSSRDKKNDQQAGRGKEEKKSADEPKRVVKVVRVIRRVVQKVVTSDSDKTSSKDVLKFFSHASKLHPVSVTDDENK